MWSHHKHRAVLAALIGIALLLSTVPLMHAVFVDGKGWELAATAASCTLVLVIGSYLTWVTSGPSRDACERRQLALLIADMRAAEKERQALYTQALADIRVAARQASDIASDATALAAESSAELMQERLAQYAAEDVNRQLQRLAVASGHLQGVLDAGPAGQAARLHVDTMLDAAEWTSVRISSLLIAGERSGRLAQQRAEASEEVACAIQDVQDAILRADRRIYVTSERVRALDAQIASMDQRVRDLGAHQGRHLHLASGR